MKLQRFIHNLVLKKSFWIIFFSFNFTYPIVRALVRELPEPLPVIRTLPAMDLIDEEGREWNEKKFRGRFLILDSLKRPCVDKCIAELKRMQKIQKRVRGLGQKVQLVSIETVSEEGSDTLFALARKMKANPNVWNFMANNNIKGSNLWSQLTSNQLEKWVLVDDQGQIRGYYSKLNADQMMIDLGLIVNNI